MKTLRIFVDDNLDQEVQWCLTEQDEIIDTGNLSFEELTAFESMPLEVYLLPTTCSIFKLNIAGIRSKNLTDELVLGLLEDRLTDDIADVKPVIMSVEDDNIYVAVFNAAYFTDLMDKIYYLNKPIRFIQSFVYATLFNDDSWTVFLNQNRSFVRTSKYQYYLIDDSEPVPLVLKDMLSQNPPARLLVYNADARHIDAFLQEVSIPVELINEEYLYGAPIWNFYNQKSNSFNFKVDQNVKDGLFGLIPTAKYFFAFLLVFWFIRVITLEFDNTRIQSKLDTVLHVDGKQTSRIKLNNLRAEILKSEHERGLYSDNDAVTLLHKFLQVVAGVDQNTITGINYQDHKMLVFLNGNLQADQFTNYKHIFTINQIDASIKDYKTYLKEKKKSDKDSNKGGDSSNNGDGSNNGTLQISDDTQWVITLRSSLKEENHANQTKSN